MTKHNQKDFNDASQEALEQLKRLQTRSVEIQEEDLVKRAEADEKSVKDNQFNIQSTVDGLEIDYRKAGRNIRESNLSLTGSALKTFVMPPNDPNEVLMGFVAMARGVVGSWDAMQDRDDILGKLNDTRAKLDTNHVDAPPPTRTKQPISMTTAGASGPT